jgi:hypothetical protein
VSFLKMIYRGNPSGRLILPSHEGLSDFTGSFVNPCSPEARTSSHGSSSDEGGSSSRSVIKFVSCDECFPDGADGASTSCDAVSDDLVVQAATKVCMAAFDETGALDLNTKFPTNLDLYFVEDGVNDVRLKTKLHMSCSTPVRYVQCGSLASMCIRIMPLMCCFICLVCRRSTVLGLRF